MKRGNLIVGLDIGSSNIRAVVGEILPPGIPGDDPFFRGLEQTCDPSDSGVLNGRDNGYAQSRVRIVGAGSSPSKGLKKGVVVNIEDTVESIRRAVADAETAAGVEIKAVYVAVGGAHIKNLPSHGVTALTDKEVGQGEIRRVISAAKAVAIPLDREVLHVIPVSFVIDGQNGISDPRGMSGVRLEANIQIITGAATSVQNLIKSCERAGLDVIDVVLNTLATAEAVVSEEEKDLGVGIVDIGGGTTDIALFHEGKICHTAVLKIGGNNFTNDIAIGLRVPGSEAERIKRHYGCAMISMITPDDEICISYGDNRQRRRLPRQHLIEIIQPRAEEIFNLVKEEIVRSGFYGLMTSGIVLTGGACLMPGIDAMAENMVELPVRAGSLRGIGGVTDVLSSPSYVSGTGLVLYGSGEIASESTLRYGNIVHGMRTKMKEWVKGYLSRVQR